MLTFGAFNKCYQQQHLHHQQQQQQQPQQQQQQPQQQQKQQQLVRIMHLHGCVRNGKKLKDARKVISKVYAKKLVKFVKNEFLHSRKT